MPTRRAQRRAEASQGTSSQKPKPRRWKMDIQLSLMQGNFEIFIRGSNGLNLTAPLNTRFWFTINQTPVTAMPSMSCRQGREQTPPHSSPLLAALVWSSTGQPAILRVGGGLDRISGKSVIGRGPSVHPHPGRQLTATVRRAQSGQGTVRLVDRRERGRGVFMTAVPVGLCSRGPSFLVSRRRSPLLTTEP